MMASYIRLTAYRDGTSSAITKVVKTDYVCLEYALAREAVELEYKLGPVWSVVSEVTTKVEFEIQCGGQYAN